MKRGYEKRIKELRTTGHTIDQIANELQCSRSTVSYHINDQVKIKAKERDKNYKYKNLIRKINFFCSRDQVNYDSKSFFSLKDVLDKFTENTECYLTGEKINLITDDYELDHIIPVSKGGSSQLDNLGIMTSKANRFKSDMTIEEIVSISKLILERFT